MFKLVKKLKSLKWPLKQLNKDNFDDIVNNTVRAKMNLEFLQIKLRDDPHNAILISQEVEAIAVLDFWRLHEAFLSFYTSLLGTYEKVIKVSNSVVKLGKVCSDEHKKLLMSPVADEEIKKDIVRLYNRKSVSPRFLMKVDLKKAYDSVSWEFLEEMLVSLEFPIQFTSLIMECVQTASYSLVLNGDIFGFFHGKKGLRQGDPLSPLLFTISMEYLSRVLGYVTENMGFRYHPLCGKVKLSHLMFADDLLLFNKGDVGSIMVLLRAFSTFSRASGLHMSPTKTNAYFNGVSVGVKEDILLTAEIQEGQLPFKYLGVPITAGRLTKSQGQILMEKITARITSFGSRHLSYSGGRAWTDYVPSGDISWGWKTVCRVRDKFSSCYNHGQWLLDPKGYTVKSGYELLRLKYQAIEWHRIVWNTWAMPKHKFFCWLLAREALQVKAKLFGLGIVPGEDCLLCGCAAEIHLHLF
ncbi:uncharacterized protein LOC141638273 [Silene latifolia]|uniref:uncharacterized protein LOC141638273 n=1 Tax=Silene latifolia TaxID=37657 RepID=UPI003D76BE1E